jgi:hypothetical protein
MKPENMCKLFTELITAFEVLAVPQNISSHSEKGLWLPATSDKFQNFSAINF